MSYNYKFELTEIIFIKKVRRVVRLLLFLPNGKTEQK